MKNTKCAVFLLFMASYVSALEKDLACCPPSTFISGDLKDKYECWDPKNNATTPIRLECNITSTRISGYDEEEGEVILEDLLHDRVAVNSTLVCIGNATSLKGVNGTWASPLALTCDNGEVYESTHIRDHFYIEDTTLGYCMTISAIFLILIVIIYCSFKDLRDNFGKSIINYCGSLAAGLFLMSIMKFVVYGGSNFCALRGFSTYFFLIAAFFWSNSISVLAMRETWGLVLPDYQWSTFKWYFLYSWGMPALLTSIMTLVNYIPGDHERPGIGLRTCWFINIKQQWFYMYSVITIIMVVNITIYFMTLRVYCSKRRDYLRCHIQEIKFKLNTAVKLFFVMGLPWAFEIVCATVDLHIIWTLISIFNSLQGVVLFLILVVDRKKVIRLLADKGCLFCCPGLIKWYIGPIETPERPNDNANGTRALNLDNVSDHYQNPDIVGYAPQRYKNLKDSNDIKAIDEP